ncbi:MAG TPA: hypothetical protein VK175_07515 [Leadbetterella sp.]|nr:hypothetical protein [Leadbetterella sp.]
MLQIAVAVLYFANKILLSLNKKAGWQIGILASSLAALYFFNLKLYLLVGLEVGFMSILIFGLVNHGKELKYQNILYIVMSVLLIFLYFVLKNSTLLEFLISLDFIVAIFFLAKKRTILGWAVMGLGHAMMAYFTYQNQQHFFAFMQILSIIVSIFAIYRSLKIRAL